ncbi:serine--tRNA ligase [Candidatus Woesearchaeota archaeon]|nr:serine--tRNA ligase [Candidatus Woesearchaeota archaeon]
MYTLELQIRLSKDADAAVMKAVEATAAELNSKLAIINQGFSHTAGHLGSTVTLTAESQAQTATDFLVQFEKRLRLALGKDLKVGVKETVITAYTVTNSIGKAPKKRHTVPFAQGVAIRGSEATLTYAGMPFDWVKEHYVERSFKLLEDKAKNEAYEGKGEFRMQLWEGARRQTPYTGDPAVDLEKKGWIRRTPGKGQFVYGPEFTALVNVIRDLLKEHVYGPLGYKEMIFPKFEPWAIPQKSGHAKNIYPYMYGVITPKDASPEAWQEVMDRYAVTGVVPADLVMGNVRCVGIMSYAQCPPFWPFVEGETLNEETLPFKVYDWSGPTYRNESGGTHGLDRLEEFHRIETLWLGTKEQVVQEWKRLKESFQTFYDMVLDMEIRVSRVTPWWMAHAGHTEDSSEPDIATFDFDAHLPYRGGREKEWLEIQNCSSNGDKYPKGFNVKGRKEGMLWSGCAGGSFQRIIVAFLAQKGLDPEGWPKAVRARFEAATEGYVPLKTY